MKTKNNTQQNPQSIKFNNIQDIFTAAGSAQMLAHFLNVHQFTVERWRRTGIPEKYHKLLIEKFDILPIEIVKINSKIMGAR